MSIPYEWCDKFEITSKTVPFLRRRTLSGPAEKRIGEKTYYTRNLDESVNRITCQAQVVFCIGDIRTDQEDDVRVLTDSDFCSLYAPEDQTHS